MKWLNFFSRNSKLSHPIPFAQGLKFWIIASSFYLYEMILRVSSAVIADDLLKAFSLSAEQLGILNSAYYWAYIPLQIPCGLILDKIGVRWLFFLSCLCCAMGALVFGETSSFWIAVLARFIIGAGSACAFIGCLRLVAGCFHPRLFAMMAGITNMMGCLGGVFAAQPWSWLVHLTGSWKVALRILGILGIFGAIWIWIGLKKAPENQEKRVKLWRAFVTLIRQPKILGMGILGGILYLPNSSFAELWAIPFLQTSHGISSQQASQWNTFFYLTAALGGPIVAWIEQIYPRKIMIMSWSSLILATCFLGLIVNQTFSLSLFYAALMGFALGGQVLVFSINKQEAPQHMAGSVSAITNALVMFMGMLFQPFVGILLDFNGGKHLNAAGVYQKSMMVFPIALFLAWVILLCIKEKPST